MRITLVKKKPLTVQARGPLTETEFITTAHGRVRADTGGGHEMSDNLYAKKTDCPPLTATTRASNERSQIDTEKLKRQRIVELPYPFQIPIGMDNGNGAGEIARSKRNEQNNRNDRNDRGAKRQNASRT